MTDTPVTKRVQNLVRTFNDVRLDGLSLVLLFGGEYATLNTLISNTFRYIFWSMAILYGLLQFETNGR
ncbi:hypothetical protein E3Q13_02069 [Wallemia mellicola]|nr:hypothetical protein E3Q13_02069 [Wallemia mellicola]